MVIIENNWNNLKSGITFEEYVNCDADAIISKSCIFDELIENWLLGAHLRNKEEESEEVTLLSFKDVLNCIDKYRIFFCVFNKCEKKIKEVTLKGFKILWTTYRY